MEHEELSGMFRHGLEEQAHQKLLIICFLLTCLLTLFVGTGIGWLLRGLRAEQIDPKCAASLDTLKQERDDIRATLLDNIRERSNLAAENLVLQTRFDDLTSRATVLYGQGEETSGSGLSGVALLGSLLIGSRATALIETIGKMKTQNADSLWPIILRRPKASNVGKMPM